MTLTSITQGAAHNRRNGLSLQSTAFSQKPQVTFHSTTLYLVYRTKTEPG